MRRSRQGVLLLMTSCSLDCFSQAGSDFKIRQGLIGWQANEHPGHIYGSGPEHKKPRPVTEPILSHTPDYSLSTSSPPGQERELSERGVRYPTGKESFGLVSSRAVGFIPRPCLQSAATVEVGKPSSPLPSSLEAPSCLGSVADL